MAPARAKRGTSNVPSIRGWRSRKMLDRYHIVSEGDLREAARKLDAQNK